MLAVKNERQQKAVCIDLFIETFSEIKVKLTVSQKEELDHALNDISAKIPDKSPAEIRHLIEEYSYENQIPGIIIKAYIITRFAPFETDAFKKDHFHRLSAAFNAFRQDSTNKDESYIPKKNTHKKGESKGVNKKTPEILRLAREGKEVYEIERETHLSKTTITKILHENNTKASKRKQKRIDMADLTLEQREKIKHLYYEKKIGMDSIRQLTKIPRKTIKKFIEENGKRPRSRKINSQVT